MGTTIESTAAADLAPAPPAASPRFRPDIEALRAIAVLAVVAFHAGVPGFDGGFVGVDVFFVISGFLITGQMLRDADGPGLRFRDFYARRARRLLPAATVVIVATLAGSALFLSPLIHASVGADARSATLFFSNMRFAADATNYFAQARNPSPFQQFWSLSVEEQFYLVWPALVAVALIGTITARAHRRRLAVVLAALVAASFALCVWLTSYSQPLAFFWLAPRAWELGVGALLAVGSARLARLGPQVRTATAGVGLLVVAASVVLISEDLAWPGALAALPVVGAGLVVASGVGGPAPVFGRVLATRPFQWGGRYSYSLYLWHWPALIIAGRVFPSIPLSWVRSLAVVAAAGVVAIASFHLVEQPVRHAKSLRAPAAALTMGSALIAVSLAASLLYGAVTVGSELDAGRPAAVSGAAIGDGVPITEYVPSDLTPTLREVAEPAPNPVPDCAPEDRARAETTCVLGAGDAPPSIYIFGDSHASHWTDGLIDYTERSGVRIRRLAAGGCGSYLVKPINEVTQNCLAWRDEVFSLIEQERPELVLLSNHSVAAYEADEAGWERGVRATIERIAPTSRVAVLGSTPWSTERVGECLALNLDDAAACEPDAAAHRAFVDRERQIATEEGAGYIDTTSWMCTDDRCPAIIGNVLVYRDKDHVTSAFVELRADQLMDAIDAQRATARP